MSNPRVIARSAANGFGGIGEVWRRLIRLAFRKPLGAFGLFLVCLQLLAASLAPLIAPYDPYEQHYDRIMVRPNLEHWFGTDNFGRDLFSRVM